MAEPTVPEPTIPAPPPPAGKLSPEDARKVISWIIAKWGPTRACPYHPDKPTSWQVGDIVQTLPYAKGSVVIGGPSYPLVVVTCLTCGQTVFVNAIIAGALPPLDQAAGGPPSSTSDSPRG